MSLINELKKQNDELIQSRDVNICLNLAPKTTKVKK